jgi:hypothetical protein
MLFMKPTPEKLITAALDNVLDARVQAHKLGMKVNLGEAVTNDEARELSRSLTVALSAALSFESLVAGNPPPKVGG